MWTRGCWQDLGILRNPSEARFPWHSLASPGIPRCPLASPGVPWHPLVSPGFPRRPLVSPGIPWYPLASPGVPLASSWHPPVSPGMPRHPLASPGCTGLPSPCMEVWTHLCMSQGEVFFCPRKQFGALCSVSGPGGGEQEAHVASPQGLAGRTHRQACKGRASGPEVLAQVLGSLQNRHPELCGERCDSESGQAYRRAGGCGFGLRDPGKIQSSSSESSGSPADFQQADQENSPPESRSGPSCPSPPPPKTESTSPRAS